MFGQGDPSVAFQQEAALQKLHTDIPEMRELLRWARLYVDHTMGQDATAFSVRVIQVLGEEFATSGGDHLALKAITKKQPEKRGQNADNTARTTDPNGG